MTTSEYWYEEVTERIGRHVIASKLRKATQEEVDEARRLHAEGKCPHTIIEDTPGWPYDFRHCVICGEGLGAI